MNDADRPRNPITDAQLMRLLAAGAIMPTDTIRRAYRTPGSVRAATLARLERAAKELGIAPPTRPESA